MSAVIRPLTEGDLAAALRICCTAFGTFLGAPEPESFWGDRDYVYGRFGGEHVASFAVELDGELVGSNFRNALGKRRLLRADYGAPRPAAARHRETTRRSRQHAAERMGRAPRRALHLPAQRSASGAL
jgi:hypothetical protein